MIAVDFATGRRTICDAAVARLQRDGVALRPGLSGFRGTHTRAVGFRRAGRRRAVALLAGQMLAREAPPFAPNAALAILAGLAASRAGGQDASLIV